MKCQTNKSIGLYYELDDSVSQEEGIIKIDWFSVQVRVPVVDDETINHRVSQ